MISVAVVSVEVSRSGHKTNAKKISSQSQFQTAGTDKEHIALYRVIIAPWIMDSVPSQLCASRTKEHARKCYLLTLSACARVRVLIVFVCVCMCVCVSIRLWRLR